MPKSDTKIKKEEKGEVKKTKRTPVKKSEKPATRVSRKKAASVSADDSNSKKKTVSKTGAAKAEKKLEPEDQYFARWTQKDFVRSEDETLFYYVSFFASALAIAWTMLERNFLPCFTFIVLSVIIIFELKSQPKDVAYEINIDGILIDGRLYKFEEIKSFEIDKKRENHVARIQFKRSLFPVKEIYLAENQDVRYIKAVLGYFLPEEKPDNLLFNFKENKKLTEEEAIEKKVNEYLRGKI